jgi:hypothetical protein
VQWINRKRRWNQVNATWRRTLSMVSEASEYHSWCWKSRIFASKVSRSKSSPVYNLTVSAFSIESVASWETCKSKRQAAARASGSTCKRQYVQAAARASVGTCKRQHVQAAPVDIDQVMGEGGSGGYCSAPWAKVVPADIAQRHG